MDRLRTVVKPGMSTLEIDEDVEDFIHRAGRGAAFKGYRGFPATVCISINEEVVHGIPSAQRAIHEGDIVGLDLGCIVEGYYADCAFTLAIGEVPPQVQQLLDVTRESLELGHPGVPAGPPTLRRLARHPVSTSRRTASRSCAPSSGHGIGRALHEEPQVPNFGDPGRGPQLRPGMVLALEPMVTMGQLGGRGSWTTAGRP